MVATPAESAGPSIAPTDADLHAALRGTQDVTWYARYGVSGEQQDVSSPTHLPAGCERGCNADLQLYGLSPQTAYHYSLCETLRGLSRCSGDETLTTDSCSATVSPPADGSDGAQLVVDSANRLSPGSTLCLRAGTYAAPVQPSNQRYEITASGTPTAMVTVTAFPGDHVKLVGWFVISGAYVRLSHMEIDGDNAAYPPGADSQCPGLPARSESLQIDGRGDVFEDNDYYQSVPSRRANGIAVGWYGQPDGAIVRQNRLHDVGQCGAHDHGIYLEAGTGVQIYRNWIWDVPHGWGIQVWPSPQSSEIYANVIDDAGSGFTIGSDATPPIATGNVVTHNVVSNSTGLPNTSIEPGVGMSTCWYRSANDSSSCDGQPGGGNLFATNLAFNNPLCASGPCALTTGITARGNLKTNSSPYADPNYAADHNYTIATNSPAAAWGIWNGQP